MIIKCPLRSPYIKSLPFGSYSALIRKMLNKADHDGVDLAAPEGTKIYGVSEKEIVMRVGQDMNGMKYVFTYYLTPNNNVFFFVYRHLKNVQVSTEQMINWETFIGEIAKDHVHFEICGAIDPEKYIKL